MQIPTHELTLGKIHSDVILLGPAEKTTKDLAAILGRPTFEIGRNDLVAEFDYSSEALYPEGPEFMVRARQNSADSTWVTFPDGIRSPGNAAVRAALQLYESKQPWFWGEGTELGDLLINDWEGRLAHEAFMPKDGRNLRWLAYPPRSVYSAAPDAKEAPDYDTIRIKNEGHQLFPDQLVDALDMYHWALPERAAQASAAVGRLVGTRSVEAFHDAWVVAAAIPDAVSAARTLLAKRHVWLENSR